MRDSPRKYIKTAVIIHIYKWHIPQKLNPFLLTLLADDITESISENNYLTAFTSSNK